MATASASYATTLDPPDTRPATSVKVRRGNNPFRLVATDMDGTLLNTHHDVSERSRRVLSQLLARGVHVIFATGRPFTDVNRIKRRLNIFAAGEQIPTPGVQVVTPTTTLPHYPSVDSIPSPASQSPTTMGPPRSERIIPRCFAVTSNGACIYDEANRCVFNQCIPPPVCEALYTMFRDDPEVNINVMRSVDAEQRKQPGYVNPSDVGDDKATDEWVSRYPADLEAAIYANSHFTFKVVPDLEESFPTTHVNQIFFLCYDPAKSRKVEDTINERMKEVEKDQHLERSVRVAPSSVFCLDIVPAQVSKASALQYVVDQLGFTLQDCIAFGDGLNDVEMLRSVGKGCIMGNANPRLKEALPQLEVIKTNDEDAVAMKLIEVFGLEDV